MGEVNDPSTGEVNCPYTPGSSQTVVANGQSNASVTQTLTVVIIN